MEAADDAAVKARLSQMGLEPTRVKKKPREIHIKIPGFGGVTTKDLLVFTRQFSMMIDAGLPLVQASRSSPRRPTTASSAACSWT